MRNKGSVLKGSVLKGSVLTGEYFHASWVEELLSYCVMRAMRESTGAVFHGAKLLDPCIRVPRQHMD
jgi:hypothetical protein